MNYQAISTALSGCVVVMAFLWRKSAKTQAQESATTAFPRTKLTYWPTPDSVVVAPGHVGAWPHPDQLDSVHAAPKQHKILFENDRIRLLEVTILPGEREHLHGHKYPSVFAFDGIQPSLNDRTPDGKELNIPRALTSNDFPACLAMGPQEPHAAKNVDTFPQHFYRLEFKKLYGKDIETTQLE